MKFKVKPFVVDAEQWFPDREIPGAHITLERGVGMFRTPEGNTYTLQPGDWIVTNAAGVKSAYTAKNFESLYDPLGPEDLSKVLAGIVGNWQKTKGNLPGEIELGEYILHAVGLDTLSNYHSEFGAKIPVKVVPGDKITLKEVTP